jgi:hypothetical protein
MFSHIMVGASNIEESKKFYDAILGELGIKPGMVMAVLLVLMSPILPRAMHGMLQGLPMEALPVKMLPVCELAVIWAICI